MRNPIALTSALLAAGLLSACGRSEANPEHHAVRDSAGIRIVENGAPAWTAAAAWRVSDEPVLSIGALDDAGAYELHRVQGAHRLANGSIVIGNGGTQELRFFDQEGRHLRSVGRRGGGPGEFEGLAEIFVIADTVFAFELFQQRISAFTEDGSLVRSFRTLVPEGGPGARPVGRFLDGTWALAFRRRMGGSGFVRDSVAYFQLSEGGEAARPIAAYPGMESLIEISTSGTTQTMTFGFPPFGRNPSAALLAGRLAHAGSDSYEIVLLDGEGSVRSMIRRRETPGPVTEADLRLWHEWSQPVQPPGAPAERQPPARPADLPVPPTKAAHGPIRSDAAGNLWVADYTHPLRTPTRWSVFDADGRWLGDLGTPDGLRITEIGDDYLLGVGRDDFGVEYVRMYSLIKP